MVSWFEAINDAVCMCAAYAWPQSANLKGGRLPLQGRMTFYVLPFHHGVKEWATNGLAWAREQAAILPSWAAILFADHWPEWCGLAAPPDQKGGTYEDH